MDEKQPLPPELATAKLVSQFDRSGEGSTLDMIVNSGESLDDAVAILTSLSATTFCADVEIGTKTTHYLTQWHASVRNECSERFRKLREENPDMDRLGLNHQDRDLMVLNGIRRGVHRVMVRNQRLDRIDKQGQ